MCAYFQKEYSDGFFNISEKHGFLPISEPLKILPSKYDKLQKLINNLHVFQNDNKDGILAIPNMIVDEVNELPNYLDIINNETDIFIIHALYRAYTFVTSSYTLEKSYQEFLVSGNYGVARDKLPSNISEPLVYVSKKLDVYPWLDYNYSYSLGNYVKINPYGTLHWNNLDMACKFTGTKDEIGFIMVHVYINELSPKLVKSVLDYGKYWNNDSLRLCGETLAKMNNRRKEMWAASRHEHYNDFRVFIMGIKGNNTIFPNGLIYENCYNDEPQFYRGQTGAQDSIIPMIDIFTGIVDFYPDNQLTQYLMDLRSYRPKCVQNFLNDLREYYQIRGNNIFNYLKKYKNYEALVYLLKIVDEVYLFRNGHWQFVQKYIMSNTKYAFATGGTPITSWLVNQIEAVLEYECQIIYFLKYVEQSCPEEILNLENYKLWNKLSNSYERKRILLEEQVNNLKNENYNIELVYGKNREYNLEDNNLKNDN